jgi:hypothetical protein
MCKFVNYKKRGVSLPPGCKELIDLIEPGKLRQAKELIAPRPGVNMPRDDSFSINLSDIGKPITAALESRGRMIMLAVASLDDQLSLDIHRMGAETLSTYVTFTESPASEWKMKAIFERLGLQVPSDSGVPGHFLKDQPVQLIYRISPEPVGAADLTALAAGIFRDFCGMEPTSELRVHYLELTDAT